MKLVYYKDAIPNFGDELNPYLWPKILPPGFLDEDESELFLGIGSILWDTFPKDARKYVVGSGYAGYTAAPDVHDGTWEVAFVRGPRTAAQLGLPAYAAICDSAVLLRTIDLPAAAEGIVVGFMPHFESLGRGLWEEVCEAAGIRLIDPRGDVEEIISAIRGTKVLITEAMHGAIVADALRTPWIAVKPISASHHNKWLDWSDALAIDLRVNDLLPSNLVEFYVGLAGRGDSAGRAGRLSRSLLGRPANRMLVYRAARHLRKLAEIEPQLSSDATIAEATERAEAALAALVASRSASRSSADRAKRSVK